MIIASFHKRNGQFVQVSIKGHADFAEYGQDILCAAVTSALQLTANGITQVLGIKATVTQKENEVIVALPKDSPPAGYEFLAALHLHLSTLAEDYSEHITITHLEV